MILAVGILLYNEIIVLPILGFNMYTAEALEARNFISKIERNSISYMKGNKNGHKTI